jgi:hypothetical protein
VAGYSDLYRLWLADGRLERLTSDRHHDVDPTVSPDGRWVVFASDRTAFGAGGARNLFRLELATGQITYLTYGDWRDDTPRWSAERDRIYFTSDRDGTPQVYSIDPTGTGWRETSVLTGAFDPQWIEGQGLVFGGFTDLQFGIYRMRPAPDSAVPPIALATEREPPGWAWPELGDPQYARADGTPYERRFSLDFAAGDAVVIPGAGSAQGAVFVFSDLLSDHLFLLSVASFQFSGGGDVLDNVNGAVLYLNQSRRLNWGVGGFRHRGLFYENDFSSVFEETSYGGFAQVRYPLSRFKRIEAEYRVEHSDRVDIASLDATEPRRVGWLASNFISYVKDNSLWLPTGPIDGERFHITGGLVNDITHGRFDSYLVAADLRRYHRTSLHSAFAFRMLGYHAGGERPRRINIGGAWGLRGYPNFNYVGGTNAWMVNAEWRFPITDFLSIGFPFGVLRLPGVQGAVFGDLGRAWLSQGGERRGVLGSAGLGLRLPLGPPLVLRLDMGWRFHEGVTTGYSLPRSSRGRRFVDFFFGFNY